MNGRYRTLLCQFDVIYKYPNSELILRGLNVRRWLTDLKAVPTSLIFQLFRLLIFTLRFGDF